MPRITLDMSISEVILTMCDGNPGALTVCVQSMKHGDAIDPDGAMGGLFYILRLDDMGIYGSRIWMLYKDVCQQDIGNLMACLRANQLGLLPTKTLLHTIDHDGDGLDVEAMVTAVREELPAFDPSARMPA